MKHSFKSGFTFIEFLLVAALMSGIALWALVNYSQQKATRELNSNRAKIVAVLRDASTRSASQSQGVSWGVHFVATSPTSSFFALFGGAYSTGTISELGVLPITLRFDTSTFSGPTKDILFDQLTGRANASTSVRIYLVGTPAESSTIRVSSSGLVSF